MIDGVWLVSSFDLHFSGGDRKHHSLPLPFLFHFFLSYPELFPKFPEVPLRCWDDFRLRESLTGIIRPVSLRRLMNLDGTSQSLMNGTCPAPLCAIISLAAIKAVTMRPWAHLILWVSQERRVRE